MFEMIFLLTEEYSLGYSIKFKQNNLRSSYLKYSLRLEKSNIFISKNNFERLPYDF